MFTKNGIDYLGKEWYNGDEISRLPIFGRDCKFWEAVFMFKKLTALVLALLMVVSAVMFAGCSKKSDDKGAMIRMYLTSCPQYLDPTALTYGSAENVKLFGLLYEGLFTIDEKGALKKQLAKKWESFEDARDGKLKLEIKLGDSNWSDGIPVDADDFVYAWQRLLLPTTDNPAAALLYPIENAKAVKEGTCSVNDLGVYAIKDNVIQITFENGFTDVDYFLRRLASPALVPLREDNATKFDDETNADYLWEASSTLALPLTNGAFKYRKFTENTMELERNIHYANVSANEDNPVDKVVKPYQLITVYKDGKTDLSTAEKQVDSFKDGELFYLNLSEAGTETVEKAGKTTENALPSQYTYFFDTTSELFSDARVRKALSIALDREYIAVLAGRSKANAAAGFVPAGVEETTGKGDFRKVGGSLFVPGGDMEGAKALLAEAGVKSGSISLDYNKERAFEKDIADYVKSVWKELGFKVTVNAKNSKMISGLAAGSTGLADRSAARVVGMDMQCLTPDAFGILAAFSGRYAGGKFDLTTENVEYTDVNITGFVSEEYDALCDVFVYSSDSKERAEALHEAEKMLFEQSPVAPLFQNTDIYASRDLSGISRNKFGGFVFTKVSQKDYRKYLPEEEEHVSLVTEQESEAGAEEPAPEETDEQQAE